MSRPTTATDRCDRILGLIDACLADVETGLRGIDGDGHTTLRHRRTPRHLALVPS